MMNLFVIYVLPFKLLRLACRETFFALNMYVVTLVILSTSLLTSWRSKRLNQVFIYPDKELT